MQRDVKDLFRKRKVEAGVYMKQFFIYCGSASWCNIGGAQPWVENIAPRYDSDEEPPVPLLRVLLIIGSMPDGL